MGSSAPAATTWADIELRPLRTDDGEALFAAVRASLRTLSPWLLWTTDAYDLAPSSTGAGGD